MHVWTHLKKSAQGRTGIGLYPDGMVEHDDIVGALLKKLDDLKIANNTIVVTRGGGGEPGRTVGPRRSGREGLDVGGRLPGAPRGALAQRHQAGHRLQRHHFPGGCDGHAARAATGVPGIKDKLKQGYQTGGKTWRVHLDGYDFLPYFKGEVRKGPREEIYYFGQGGELNAVRWNDWKVHFAVQQGNIATSVREVTGWPTIVNPQS